MNYLKVIIGMVLLFEVYGNSDDEAVEKACSVRRLPHNLAELIDVLPHICSELKIGDLCNVEAICTSFRDAAQMILRKRGIDIKIVKIKEIWPTVHDQSPNQVRLKNIIRIKPKVAFFMSDSLNAYPNRIGRSRGIYNSVPDELFARYMPQLPKTSRLFYILGSRILLKGNPVEAMENNALGLFIPEWLNAQIESHYLTFPQFESVLESPDPTSHYFRYLLSGIQSSKKENFRGLIMFNADNTLRTNNEQRFIVEATRKFIHRSEKFALWGSETIRMIAADQGSISLASMILSLSGPKVKCWSLLVDTSQSELELKRKITKFRTAISVIRGRTVALSLNRASYNDDLNDKILLANNQIFASAFQDVELLYFEIGFNVFYCYDTLGPNDSESQIMYDVDKHVCYMVITHE